MGHCDGWVWTHWRRPFLYGPLWGQATDGKTLVAGKAGGSRLHWATLKSCEWPNKGNSSHAADGDLWPRWSLGRKLKRDLTGGAASEKIIVHVRGILATNFSYATPLAKSRLSLRSSGRLARKSPPTE